MSVNVLTTFVGNIRSLWDLVAGKRKEESKTRPVQNGQQHRYNNNGLCSIGGISSRKRKAESDFYYTSCVTEEEHETAPKYMRLISLMSQEKKRNGAKMSNGNSTSKNSIPASSSQLSNLYTGKGLIWTENPGNRFNPHQLTKEIHLNQSHADHKRVRDMFNEWDSFSDGYPLSPVPTNKPTATRIRTSKHFTPAQRKSEAPKVVSIDTSKQISGPFRPISTKPTSSYQVSLFSTNTYRNKTFSAPLQKPEMISLEEDEEEEVQVIEPKPKIFDFTPTMRRRMVFGTGASGPYSPFELTSSSKSIATSQAHSKLANIDTTNDDDDDLQIIAENIVSPKYKPYRSNSLELEIRNSIYRQKSWLENSQDKFWGDRKSREDIIDYETKKLAVLKNRSTLPNDIESRIRNNLTITDIIVLEPEEPLLPPITSTMRGIIETSIRGREAEVVVTSFNNIPITKGDLKTLAPCQWLNDNIINTYMDMIALRSKSETQYPRVHVFTTFFYPKFLKEGYSSILKRWTRKVDIFSVELIIFPIHLGIHWCLAVADLRHKTIKFYDSLLGNQSRCLDALMSYLSSEHQERKKSPLIRSEWILSLEKGIPTQENGSDCGVFSCKFAEYLSRDVALTFKQKDMNYYRDRMVYEIVKQDLMYP